MSLTVELTRWTAMASGQVASTEELAMLVTCAECASPDEVVDAVLWRTLSQALHDHGGFSGTPKEIERKIAQQVRSAHLKADLGAYPKNPKHFVHLFIESRTIRMTYAGQIYVGKSERSMEYVENMLRLCCDTHGLRIDPYLTAFTIWRMDEQPRLLAAAYETIRHVPGLDDDWTELTRFAALLVADGADAEITARNRRGATVALAQFVWRVKNHMRGRWQHKAHLMPVLYGPTGSGKTTAVQHLLEPLPGLHMDVGFDLLDDNSKSYDLSTMPVMVFEEMAGASKSDVNKIKAIMHTATRQMRQAYEAATVRTVMSTFFGCSNKDISDTIKDETSNRRFFQIAVLNVDLKALKQIDATRIWQSINENAEAPMYASKADLDIITSIQAEQRHVGVVEQWLLEASFDARPYKASDLFSGHFRSWCEDYDPLAAKSWNAAKLGAELARLADTAAWRDKIAVKQVHKSNRYSFSIDPVGSEIVSLPVGGRRSGGGLGPDTPAAILRKTG